MREIPIIPIHRLESSRPRTGWLARLGTAMQAHRRTILALQWIVVLAYLTLLVVPAFMPIPPEDAHLWDNLRLFAQFLFWGIWWPFVMVSMMLMGRVWCGVFCPEGALSELASRHGLGRAIPRWLRWSGWPFVAFVCTTVYGQLVSVYEYPQAALLVLGGSTVAAVGIGLVYGRGKRVWCRYLCPANGVFALLAKIAPVHFRVNEEAWKASAERGRMVDCAPLINIRHMKSASACHACGRCSGYRGAVELALRSPAHEILNTTKREVRTEEALTLMVGVLGIATAAFLWSSSRMLVQVKSWLANWLVEHDILWPLNDDAPWWLLTHYPAANDMFTWLDGLCILAYILGGGVAVGLAVVACVRLAAWVARDEALSWQRLSLGLVPLAGMSIFLGLSMLTLGHLKAERVSLEWVAPVRVVLMVLGTAFAAWLGLRLLRPTAPRRLAALALYLLPLALIDTIWALNFF
jgi:polyferredoxin